MEADRGFSGDKLEKQLQWQKITFGLHLDGQRAVAPKNCLGEITVGPLGLLTILETQLGLLGTQPSQSERIVLYRDCLKRADEPSRFYHETFAIDELGTAATLLAWRDAWYLDGWNGEFAGQAPRRLADLAAVDALVNGGVAPSVGERLIAVLAALDSRRPAIGSVVLMDPVAALPVRWRQVLSRLTVISAGNNPVCQGDGLLGHLQRNLSAAASTAPFDKLAWQDDGTVTVVRAETKFLSGAWLAAHLHEHEPMATLLVAPSDGARLDAALVSADQPRQGLREASAFRPALQVLPLVLELLWEPINLHGLVQFLTHPVCPIPGYARRRLAAKVADRPGIGGARWDRVLEDIDGHYGDTAAAIREAIRFWIEHPRYRQEDGAPLAQVLERIDALAGFFRGHLGDDDPARRPANQAAFSQCRACAAALTGLIAQGTATIRPRQLQTLVAQATAQGTENPLLVPEVGATQAITHPGAAIEPVDHVIWWHFAAPALPSPYPWSGTELSALAAAGVGLPTMAERLNRAAWEWLGPIFAARRHLTLVLPPEGEEVHPVWQMIEAVVDAIPIKFLESLTVEPNTDTRPVDHRPLPTPRRWWQLPADVKVALRPQESFSSLELLLFNPYHWLLRYPARLHPSNLITMTGEFRLFGNLAHELIERLFLRPDALAMTDAQCDGWFDEMFPQLVAEEGALLLMPGKGTDLENFRFRLGVAMRQIRFNAARAGIVQVSPELPVSGQFAGGDLAGFADLVMERADGHLSIVDMKWSGAKKFPAKLRDNRHLQLAIYAELLRQTRGHWPAVGYFLLDRARLLAPDASYFPDADAVPSASGENTAQLWQHFQASWRWRRAQIEMGRFEVALQDIEPTEESQPPEDAMLPEYLSESYNDYLALAGWRSE